MEDDNSDAPPRQEEGERQPQEEEQLRRQEEEQRQRQEEGEPQPQEEEQLRLLEAYEKIINIGNALVSGNMPSENSINSLQNFPGFVDIVRKMSITDKDIAILAGFPQRRASQSAQRYRTRLAEAQETYARQMKVRKQKEKNAKRIILGRRERKKMPRNLKVRRKILAYEETLRKGLEHVSEKFGEIMTTVRSKTFAVEGGLTAVPHAVVTTTTNNVVVLYVETIIAKSGYNRPYKTSTGDFSGFQGREVDAAKLAYAMGIVKKKSR